MLKMDLWNYARIEWPRHHEIFQVFSAMLFLDISYSSLEVYYSGLERT
jgi:hypothetical protein